MAISVGSSGATAGMMPWVTSAASATTCVAPTLLLQQQVGHDLLQLIILLPEFPHLAGSAGQHGTMLLPPAIEGGLGDPHGATHLHGRRPPVGDLPKRCDNLRVREFARPHSITLPFRTRMNGRTMERDCPHSTMLPLGRRSALFHIATAAG